MKPEYKKVYFTNNESLIKWMNQRKRVYSYDDLFQKDYLYKIKNGILIIIKNINNTNNSKSAYSINDPNFIKAMNPYKLVKI